MADFSKEKKYDYNWQNSKFKDLLFVGSNISNLVNDAGYITSADSSLSASYALTASYVNPLRQNVYITGSLNVTGSTLQVGNNTLLGNTTLSGSIIISGSTTTPSTPTIKVYGDMETNGVIKFMPVVKSIDNSISASYIFVSGSTNDLYFSQNGSGYSNVTRLRWLEGNLYTGLLNGGLITATNGTTTYNIGSGSGIIVNLNASLSTNPFPTIEYVNWGDKRNIPITLTSSYDQTFVGIGTGGNVVTQGTPFYDGQIDTQIPIGIVLHQNRLNINGTKTQPSVAYGWKQRSNVFISAFGPLKLSGLVLAVSASSTGSLIVGSGTAFQDGANYPLDPNNPSYVIDPGTNVSKIFRYYQSGSDWVYDTNAAAGYGAIDPTKYSLNGTLTPVPTNDWSIQRVYYFTNSVTKAIVVYYGNNHYTTELDAIANLNVESFTEAPNTAANAVYLGALIVRYNANFTTATSFKILPGGLFRAIGGSGGGGGSVTQTLSGLSDVSITSPTAGQPLAYNSSTLKWNNTSSITANLTGNASTATSASFASTASYVTNLNQNVSISGVTSLGNGTFTKAGSATGDVLLDNNGTDTPGVLFYYANNSNYGIDSWSGSFDVLSGQLVRVTNKLNETGGAVKLAIDTTGNAVFTGFVKANAWRAGQVVNDIMLSNTEVTISTTTIATSTSDTDFLTYSYTPLSSTSYLVIHYHLANYDFSGGTGNDSYISRIKVDGGEITYSTQSTVNGNRSGVLFPLTGRYTNSSTSAKSIVVACRRNSADDSITITNSSTSMWLRITEIAR